MMWGGFYVENGVAGVNARQAKKYTAYEMAETALQHFGVTGTYMGRLRGGYAYNTSSGVVIVDVYSGSSQRLEAHARVCEELAVNGICVSCYIKDGDSSYIYEGEANNAYTVYTFCPFQECGDKSFDNVCISIRALAGLHKALTEKISVQNLGLDGSEFQIARSYIKEYDKHNKELKTIRNYLAGRKTKTDFELLAHRECNAYLDEGTDALERLKNSGYELRFEQAVNENKLCHGDFNYHNVYTDGSRYLITGLSHMRYDLYIVDLYCFMRKLMEKYDWDIKMGYLMLREYDKVNTLSAQDIKILGAMFAYPEKFWKILNFYFNNNKAWIPGRSMEKLRTVVNQNRMRREFVRTLYGS